MAQTTFWQWIFPDKGERPYYDKISEFFNKIDGEVYVGHEKDNYVIVGGGTISYDSGQGKLTWSEAIICRNLVTGYSYTILAGNLIGLSNGDYIYIDIDRGLNSDKQTTLKSGNSVLGMNSNMLIIGYIYGDSFWTNIMRKI